MGVVLRLTPLGASQPPDTASRAAEPTDLLVTTSLHEISATSLRTNVGGVLNTSLNSITHFDLVSTDEATLRNV